MTDDTHADETDHCPLVDTGAFAPPTVNHCPACGGDVEATDTPTMHRCVESGKIFYVEV